MEFSLIIEAQTVSPADEARTLLEAVEQAVAAETAGFHRVWSIEHHALAGFAHMSAPEVFLAWVAARTTRLRLGYGAAMQFGYNHPIRTAERVAMMDALSGGRVDLAGGPGATDHESTLFNVDLTHGDEETNEAFAMIASVWRTESFQWPGPLLRISPPLGRDPHVVVPRPVQHPHPPLFLRCTDVAGASRAGAMGIGAIALGFGGLEAGRDMQEAYSHQLAKRLPSEQPSNSHFGMLCPTLVLDDDRAARQEAARGQRYFLDALHHWYRGAPPPTPASATELVELDDWFAYGDADQATAYVEAMARLGIDEVICLMQMGTIPHELCMESIRQWGARVIPAFS